MGKELFLMNKDHCVLQMEYDEEIHGILKIDEVHELEYAPPAILDHKGTLNRKTLNDWWRERTIPISRNYLETDFPYIQDPRELAERSMGLSLSDRYWVSDDPKTQKWADVNFFDNAFTDDLGLITLGEQHQSSNHSENLYSPNATLGGDLQKKWTIQNGERVLLKSGSHLFRQEPYNEVIATVLHKQLLDRSDFVPYSLQGRYSICPNMLGPDEELVPMWDVLQNKAKPNDINDYQFCINTCKELGLSESSVKEHLEKMFTCDFIIANSDRHYRNFGLIRNVETLEYVRMAPIYDTGASLWYDKDLLENPKDYEYRAKPFNPHGMIPSEQLRLFHDFDWFEPEKLEGFVEEAGEILAEDRLMPESRRKQVMKGLRQNLETAVAYINGKHLTTGINSISMEKGDAL